MPRKKDETPPTEKPIDVPTVAPHRYPSDMLDFLERMRPELVQLGVEYEHAPGRWRLTRDRWDFGPGDHIDLSADELADFVLRSVLGFVEERSDDPPERFRVKARVKAGAPRRHPVRVDIGGDGKPVLVDDDGGIIGGDGDPAYRALMAANKALETANSQYSGIAFKCLESVRRCTEGFGAAAEAVAKVLQAAAEQAGKSSDAQIRAMELEIARDKDREEAQTERERIRVIETSLGRVLDPLGDQIGDSFGKWAKSKNWTAKAIERFRRGAERKGVWPQFLALLGGDAADMLQAAQDAESSADSDTILREMIARLRPEFSEEKISQCRALLGPTLTQQLMDLFARVGD